MSVRNVSALTKSSTSTRSAGMPSLRRKRGSGFRLPGFPRTNRFLTQDDLNLSSIHGTIDPYTESTVLVLVQRDADSALVQGDLKR